MSADEKMLRIGIYAFFAVVFLTEILQVCYKTQDQARNRIRNETVKVQQEIATRQTVFATNVRPENLRNLVTGVIPNAEIIGFKKTISIDAIPLRVVGE